MSHEYKYGDRVRPTPAAVKRDRNKPSHDYSKRTFDMVGTVVGTRLTSRGHPEYTVQWDTAPGQAFSYFKQLQSPSMIQLERTNE